MVDKSQCQTHTRTPWGKSAHLYDRRIRYLFMGILFVTFLAAVVVSVLVVVDLANGH